MREWLQENHLDPMWANPSGTGFDLTLRQDGTIEATGLGKELPKGVVYVGRKDWPILVKLLKAIEAFNQL